MTRDDFPSMMETHEFVVPKSIPTTGPNTNSTEVDLEMKNYAPLILVFIFLAIEDRGMPCKQNVLGLGG